MIADLWTMTLKSWKDLFLYRGGLISTAVSLAVFGVVQPWEGGVEFLTGPIMPLVLIWLPVFVVAPMTADSFAGERERHTLETLLASRLSDRAILFGKIAGVVSYGWLLALGSLALATLTVTAFHGHGRWVSPPLNSLLLIVTMTLLGALAAAAGGVLISLGAPTVRQAQQILSVSLLVLIFGLVFGARALPPAWKLRLAAAFGGPHLMATEVAAAAVLVLLDLILLAAAKARFQRARLILD